VVLSAEGLTRSFGKREVVSDVSFEVRAGEVFGFLGPNGAGKTTTIRMLVGLARPDRGRVRMRDFDLARDFARAMAHVGSIVESPDLYGYLTGRENLQHFARMLPDGAEGRIAELASLVDENVEVKQLGTGFTFTEGPIWNPKEQFLLFSDMPGACLIIERKNSCSA